MCRNQNRRPLASLARPISTALATTLAAGAVLLTTTGCYKRTIRAEGITAKYTYNKKQDPQTTIDQDIAREVRGWFDGDDDNRIPRAPKPPRDQD